MGQYHRKIEEPDLRDRLHRDILDLKMTLETMEEDSTQLVYSIADKCKRIYSILCTAFKIKRILAILQEISDKRINIQHCFFFPIHDLLSVGPLTRTEIPLDVLSKLIYVGFDENCLNDRNKICLDIAIRNQHYNATRLLLKYGAVIMNDHNISHDLNVINLLASQPNVPLDLFDILATPQNANLCSPCRSLPLHKAVTCGHTATALHLIKLGARVDKTDGWTKLPVEYYLEKCINQFNTDVFRTLLPARCHGKHVLRCVFTILNDELNKKNTDLFAMFCQLLQRLHFSDSLKVECDLLRDRYGDRIYVGYMSINNITLGYGMSLLDAYLCSLILFELQFYFTATPDVVTDTLPSRATEMEVHYAQACDDIWKNCSQQGHVASLLRLCILCIRNSMSRLDDESFLSLPVPPYIRSLLTYRDISEKIFQEWQRGSTM